MTIRRENNIKSLVGNALVILGVIYLALIPSGLIKKKFEPVDVGVLMALLVANSDIIERISQLKIGKDGVELSVDEFKEEIKEEVKEDVKKQMEAQENKASKVLQSIDLLLSETTSLEIPIDELKKQIANVTPVIAEYIYYRAKEVRHMASLCKRNGKPKQGLIERTIPIFQALIQSKHGENRHRFYAQLGYALKDQDFPDWQSAKDNLNKAIKLWKREYSARSKNKAIELWKRDHSDRSKAFPPAHYCFNWIICVVELAKENRLQQVDFTEVRERIEAAASCAPLREKLEQNQDLQDWFGRENLKAALETSNGSCRREQYEEDNVFARN